MTTPARPPLSLLLGLGGLGFTTMAGYAIARPASESLFLTHHQSARLPAAWIAVACTAALVAAAYAQAARRFRLPALFAGAALLSAAAFVLVLSALARGVPGSAFALYVLKDVYVVVLVEIFWSFANVTFRVHAARSYYGRFLLAGSLGGLCGNFGVGPLSAWASTAGVLWLVPALLTATALVVLTFTPRAIAEAELADGSRSLAEGFRVLSGSNYLMYLLALIAVVQVVMTLVDFEYNRLLEVSYPDTDARTRVIGQVYGTIDGSAVLLQLLAGGVLRLLGVPATLLLIPGLMICAQSVALLWPGFLWVAALKVFSKSADYSLFRAAKEILYIPLDYREKTEGKAFVDMMTYRVAKGGASLLLLLVAGRKGWVPPLVLGLLAAWIALTAVIVRRYRQKVSREAERATSISLSES